MAIWQWIKQQFWRFGNFIEGFLVGDGAWGLARMFVLGALGLAFALLGWLLFEPGTVKFLEPKTWGHVLRYLIVPFGAFVAALLWGARYLQDIYEMKGYKLTLRYMISSLFGVLYPFLTIDQGKKQVEVGEENLLDVIGGPGYVIIRPGNVVLFEHLTNPSSVRAEGMHFISRFESIKQIANLEDQHGYIEKLRAITRDGVWVVAKDIHYRYRLWSSHKLGGENIRSTHVPYPYSVQAVRNMTYNRAMRSDGLTSWAAAVQIVFEGEIQNYIRTHTIDEVTAPRTENANPRGDIHRLYASSNIRNAFKNSGVQLLWYGIGNLEAESEKVNDQRVETWSAGWRGQADVTRASGQATAEVNREKARAEAQAQILQGIVRALNDIRNMGPDRDRNMQDVFLFRVAQLLEAMKDENKALPAGEK